MKEIWKDIEGYKGLYQASNLGRIRSLTHEVHCGLTPHSKAIKKGKILQAHPNLRKYLTVVLSAKNKRKTITVHRLIAQTFIPNPQNLPQVNHIDGDKNNNCVNNLEWCSAKENIQHSWKNGLSKSYTHPKGVLTKYSASLCKQVDQFDLYNNYIKTFSSVSEASRMMNCSISNIKDCCRGRQKTAKGFIWRFH